MKGLLKKVFAVAMSALMVFLAPVSVSAISEADLYFYGQNNILFFDASGTKCAPGTISGGNVTIIGDSISVGARSQYSSQIPNADYASKTYNGNTYNLVQDSKQFSGGSSTNYSGMTIVEVLQQQGELRPYLVFALGTNSPGGVTDSSINELMNLVGTNHKVVLVTNYALDNQRDYSVNNAAIRSAGNRYSNVAVADWAKAVESDPTRYINDRTYYVHPNEAGSELFVKLIKEALNTLAGGSSGISTGSNQNYAGAQVWSESELQAIEANRPFYEDAANKYGFPWQLLAVIHKHEHGLARDNPSNGQGAYQLYSYTGGGTNENAFFPVGPLSDAEFARQTDIAAQVVVSKASGMDLNNLTDDNIKTIFFRYNGTAQQYIDKALALGFSAEEASYGEGSPYVMNRYDAQRDPTSSSVNPVWAGRFTGDGEYSAGSASSGFGAFVHWQALVGSSYCSSAGSGIVETAIELSWEGYSKHSVNDPKLEYVAAMQAVGSYILPCGHGGECPPYGASCDQFVSTVMRYSGADPNFPIFHGSYHNASGRMGQNYYMDDHPEMYEKIDNLGDTSNLEPGDIFVVNNESNSGYHIFLYIGEIDGKPSQASASWGGRTGEHYAGLSFSDYGMPYSIYRRIQ